MPINKNILEEYVDTFITYEKQTHGIDPRDTLEGTVLRSKGNVGEGYKERVYETGRTLLKKEDSYTDAILKALPGEGLAFRRYDKKLREILDEKGSDNFEESLKLLYDDGKDEQAGGSACDTGSATGRTGHQSRRR